LIGSLGKGLPRGIRFNCPGDKIEAAISGLAKKLAVAEVLDHKLKAAGKDYLMIAPDANSIARAKYQQQLGIQILGQ